VASLLGHGSGFSARPCPAMGPGHYGEVSRVLLTEDGVRRGDFVNDHLRKRVKP
jgi:hypothetical protein